MKNRAEAERKQEINKRRAAARKAELAINHVGVLNRAQTFKDKRREASRNACRKGAWT